MEVSCQPHNPTRCPRGNGSLYSPDTELGGSARRLGYSGPEIKVPAPDKNRISDVQPYVLISFTEPYLAATGCHNRLFIRVYTPTRLN